MKDDVHTSEFYADNNSGGPVRLAIVDPVSQVELAHSGWRSGKRVSLKFSSVGGRHFHFTVERRTTSQSGISVGWKTAVSYFTGLIASEPTPPFGIELECVDETGWDWTGSDEIVLELHLDSEVIFKSSPVWEANTGQIIHFTQRRPFGFLSGQRLVACLFELELLQTAQHGSSRIAALKKNEAGDDLVVQAARETSVKVGGGEYLLRHFLTRKRVRC